jgi:methylmalonyl-CoA mutase
MSEPVRQLADTFPAASLDAWRSLVDKALKGGDFQRRLVSRSADGIAIEPLYAARPADTDNAARPSCATGPGWQIAQRHADADPVAANSAILEDLSGGVSAIVLQIESPGQHGLSYRAEPIARALEGVLLDVCPVVLDARENTLDAAGSLIAAWRAYGVAEERRRGAFNLDPLGTLARTGSLYYPPQKSLSLAAELLSQTLAMPGVAALAADGRPYHEAGASEAQELAATLATLIAELRAAEAAGIAPGRAVRGIRIELSADADVLMVMAKFRAARQLVRRVLDACGAADAPLPEISASTSERMMTRRDPWVNLLRTTAACAAAAFGGADSITVLPFTWALGQPDRFARRIARNVQIVLQEEAGLGRVADPAAGSFAIETLTGELSARAWTLMQHIEGQGGMAAALTSGWLQDEIASVAEARMAAIATGKLALTGTSAFPMLGKDGVEVTPWPASPPLAQGGAVARRLAPQRLASQFEALRDAADVHAARTGAPPRVFLAALGPLAAHAARVTWIANFLAAGGIAVSVSEPVHASASAGAQFATSGAEIACICGSDESYGELGESTASILKQAGARVVYLAGRPRTGEADLRTAGVDDLIFAGANAVEVLGRLHDQLGLSRPKADDGRH